MDGDVKTARSLIVKASKNLELKVIEGGYKAKEKIYSTKKADFAMVRKGDRVIGHLKFTAPRIGRGDWELVEERR